MVIFVIYSNCKRRAYKHFEKWLNITFVKKYINAHQVEAVHSMQKSETYNPELNAIVSV